jgi:hypothetical protein
MSALSLLDRFTTTLASSYTSGGVSLIITSATSGGVTLPSGACDYYLTVEAEGANTEEVFHVTNRAGTTLTVAGAQANTSASNHASAAVIQASTMGSLAYAQLKVDAATGAVKTAPVRLMATVYQNTGTTPRIVAVVFAMSGAAGDVYVTSDSINPPTTPTFYTSSPGGGAFASVFFIVPAGDYYEIQTNTTLSVTQWNEYQ